MIGARSAGVARETLLSIFWPESAEEDARNALNQALFVLRRNLPEEAILRTPAGVRLDTSVLACDALEFQDAIDQSRLEDAVALHAGPFLDGVHVRDAPAFHEWLDTEAARFTRHYLDALERLATASTVAGDLLGAVGWWKRLAAADPGNSRVALRLMKAHVAARDPAAALAHARVHDVLLREEFGAACDAAILAFAERIRNGDALPPPDAQPAFGPAVTLDVELASEEGAAANAAAGEDSRRESAPLAGRTAPGDAGRWKVPVVAAIVIATVIAIVGGLLGIGGRPRSIAVLPFRTLASDGDSVPAYLRDGLAEGLINALAQADGMRVVARTSAFRAAEAQGDPTQLAGRLGVDAIVVGSIQPDGDDYRVTARLVHADRGDVLWSQTFRRRQSDVLALEMEIAGAIARRLNVGSGPAVTPPGSTRSETAHALYLQGLYLWNLRRGEDLQRALRYFERAVAEDEGYGLAHALIAQTHLLLAGGGGVPPEEATRLAAAAAHRALAIDDRISAAHAALAATDQANREWEAAERGYQRALQLNPNDALAHSWYGFLLIYSGRGQSGVRELELARQLDPLSLGISANLAWGYYFTGRYTQAADAFTGTLEHDSSSFAMHNGLGRALQQLGRMHEALAAYRRAVAIGGTAQGKAILAQALARFGFRDEAREIREELARHAPVDPFLLAIIDVGLGDLDSAFGELELAMAAGSRGLVQVAVDPIFAPLRRDSRYLRLLPRIAPVNQADISSTPQVVERRSAALAWR